MEDKKGNELVEIRSLMRRARIINLPHRKFCKALGSCRCTMLEMQTTSLNEKGETVFHNHARRGSSSIHFLALSTMRLPRAFLQIKEVARMIEGGLLVEIPSKPPELAESLLRSKTKPRRSARNPKTKK